MLNERDVQNSEKFCNLIIIYKIFQNSCFIAMLLRSDLKARAIDFTMISGMLVI